MRSAEGSWSGKYHTTSDLAALTYTKSVCPFDPSTHGHRPITRYLLTLEVLFGKSRWPISLVSYEYIPRDISGTALSIDDRSWTNSQPRFSPVPGPDVIAWFDLSLSSFISFFSPPSILSLISVRLFDQWNILWPGMVFPLPISGGVCFCLFEVRIWRLWEDLQRFAIIAEPSISRQLLGLMKIFRDLVKHIFFFTY